MARFVFNGGALNAEVLGIQRYTIEILKELDKIVDEGEVEVAVPVHSTFSYPFERVRIVRVPCRGPLKRSSSMWGQIWFPRYVRRSGGVGVDTLLAMPMRGCDVIAIFDCINEYFPQNYEGVKARLGYASYLFRVKRAMTHAKLILTDSDTAKSDLVSYYGRPANGVTVVPCGWQHIFEAEVDGEILRKLGLDDADYCFSLGSRFVHKNFLWVLHAARQNPNIAFVVSGTNSFGIHDLGYQEDLPENLVFTGYLNDGEIKALMTHCKAFIQPSLIEGFGIPPLEAMACGANCIVSDIAVFREIYQDAVWYVDPLKYDGIHIDKILAEELCGRKERILERYSWSNSAKYMLDCLNSLQGGSR